MREKKFTPGPWNVEKENIHIGSIATCHGDKEDGYYEVWTSNWMDSGIDQKANANLIAAAPELLEALEDLVEQICSVDGCAQLSIDMAELAIKSSYGEKP